VRSAWRFVTAAESDRHPTGKLTVRSANLQRTERLVGLPTTCSKGAESFRYGRSRHTFRCILSFSDTVHKYVRVAYKASKKYPSPTLLSPLSLHFRLTVYREYSRRRDRSVSGHTCGAQGCALMHVSRSCRPVAKMNIKYTQPAL
jgi:hypothetical protein